MIKYKFVGSYLLLYNRRNKGICGILTDLAQQVTKMTLKICNIKQQNLQDLAISCTTDT